MSTATPPLPLELAQRIDRLAPLLCRMAPEAARAHLLTLASLAYWTGAHAQSSETLATLRASVAIGRARAKA